MADLKKMKKVREHLAVSERCFDKAQQEASDPTTIALSKGLLALALAFAELTDISIDDMSVNETPEKGG